jgi:hypothetical protein
MRLKNIFPRRPRSSHEEEVARLTHQLWSRSFPSAKTWTSPEVAARYTLIRYMTRDRASFLLEAGRHIPALGIENPLEPGALSFQALHPFAQEDLISRIEALGYEATVAASIEKAGFSLLDFSFVCNWFRYESLFNDLESELGLELREYLLDPYSGFLHWIEAGRNRNTPLVYGAWWRHMMQLAPESAKWMRDHKEDTLLSQGALLFRDLFPELVPAASPTNRCEVFDLTVRTEDEFDEFFKKLAELRQRQPLINLWYRGQPEEYLLPNREELISQGIAQYSNVVDPSLVPSIYRHLREYSRTEESYERFCRIVAEWVRRADTLFGPSFELFMNERPVSAATYELPDDARVVMKLMYPDGGLHPRQSSDQGVPCASSRGGCWTIRIVPSRRSTNNTALGGRP